jgi:hypothetical protein
VLHYSSFKEEEALNLLFLGDTNRAIAETPMNLASSRSHCLFTVFVESRTRGSDTVRTYYMCYYLRCDFVDLCAHARVFFACACMNHYLLFLRLESGEGTSLSNE